MVTWKGVLREAERAARRAAREAEKQRKIQEKQRQFALAEAEVAEYHTLLESLGSLHSDRSEYIEWKAVAKQVPPEEPEETHTREVRARRRLDGYEPSFLDKLLRRGNKKRTELSTTLRHAITEDQREFDKKMETFKKDYAEWEQETRLAERVLEGEPAAYGEVIERLDPVESVPGVESLDQFHTHSRTLVSAVIRVQDTDIVPSQRKRVLKSGKLSTSNMPKSDFYGHYARYVASCVIGTARELLAVVPADVAVVTATTKMLNPGTGHIEEQPILSVAILKKTIKRLNLDKLDPVAALENFVHNISFMKTKGFKATEPLDPSEFLE